VEKDHVVSSSAWASSQSFKDAKDCQDLLHRRHLSPATFFFLYAGSLRSYLHLIDDFWVSSHTPSSSPLHVPWIDEHKRRSI
jgi:hypothetical protein